VAQHTATSTRATAANEIATASPLPPDIRRSLRARADTGLCLARVCIGHRRHQCLLNIHRRTPSGARQAGTAKPRHNPHPAVIGAEVDAESRRPRLLYAPDIGFQAAPESSSLPLAIEEIIALNRLTGNFLQRTTNLLYSYVVVETSLNS